MARQALGYKEVMEYINGDYDRDEAIKRVSTNTRHFAKRQLTWWRGDSRIQWIDLEHNARADDVVEKIIDIFSGGKNND